MDPKNPIGRAPASLVDTRSAHGTTSGGHLAIMVCFVALALALPGCALGNAQAATSAQGPTPNTNTTAKPTVHEVAQTTTLTNLNSGHARATCPEGEVALGGGWTVPSPGARVYAAMVNGASWDVYAAQSAQPGGVVVPITVTAYVECLRGAAGAVVTQHTSSLTLAPTPATESNDHLGTTMLNTCDQGETLVGGGFNLGAASAGLELEANWPGTFQFGIGAVTGWLFTVRNHDSVSHDLTFFGECLANVADSVSYPRQDGSPIHAGATASTVASCPTGASVAGGGMRYFRHDSGNQYLGEMANLHTAASGWQGDVYAISGFGLVPLSSTVSAVCLTFA